MKNISTICLFILLTFYLEACGQTSNNRTVLGKNQAEQDLKTALTDKTQHNVIDNNTIIIKDSTTAVNIVEPILFGIYGKDKIVDQRPYESYFIDNYWIIRGTLPKDSFGGTFLIILDSRTCQVMKITHGK